MDDVSIARAKELLVDPVWRLNNLYKVINKEQEVVTFRPNVAQQKLLDEMHTRNVIPKARQRGLSTVIQILMLDTALFSTNFTGKVIAQDKDAALEIFRGKLKFAYDNLPPFIREAIRTEREAASGLIFSNGSSVSVTTSARSGTVQMLHVSEFGKIAAKWPQKAREVMTGSIPAVPRDGIVFVESTAEGAEGEFYEIVKRAKALNEASKKLTPLDFKLHFYSWWDAGEYELPPSVSDDVILDKRDREYFAELEHTIGRQLSFAKRAWYVKTRDAFNSQERMWQEFPSTVDECFQVSTEGTYYAEQLARARKESRIARVPHDPSLPTMTFWDIGQNDETAIWCVQQDRFSFRCINYIEASDEPFGYFVNQLKDLGYTWSRHYLPHDANYKRQQGQVNQSALDMLKKLAPGWRFDVIARIPDIQTGIQQTRDVFSLCYFDEANCARGLHRLTMYKKEWDEKRGCWRNTPKHDDAGHSNGADAFRQLGQAYAAGKLPYGGPSTGGGVVVSRGDSIVGL